MRAALAGIVAWVAAPAAWAGADYDPVNLDWNGGSRLVALGAQAKLRVEPKGVLDLGALQPRVAILILGPQRAIPEELRSFVRQGGRVAIADDGAAGARLLSGYGFERVAEPRVSIAYGGVPHLAMAFPRRRHMLVWGVDSVVTNHPAALRSAKRMPLLGFDGDDGLLYAIPDGDGELVALADPSVLINQMLPFADNEHFARDLLRYLARGSPSRPIWVLHGAFDVQGTLRADLRPRGAAAVAADLRALAEDGAYGANTVAWELQHQRPLSGVFMALSVFAGGAALLLLAALWGGTTAFPRPRALAAEEAPALERAGRQERARLGAALRAAIEERLGEEESDDPARRRVRAALSALPVGEADPLARRLSARRLRRLLGEAERVLGPLGTRGVGHARR